MENTSFSKEKAPARVAIKPISQPSAEEISQLNGLYANHQLNSLN
jgi:hypothetical protein